MAEAGPITQVGAAESPASSGATPVSPRPTRFDLRIGVRGIGFVVVLAAIVVSLFSVASLSSPNIPLAIRNDDLDRAISGLAAGIAAMAALLQWNRYREDKDPSALLLATALLVLAAENAFSLLVAITGLQDALGFSLRNPGQAPIYGWILSRALAGTLFGLAALAQLRHWKRSPPAAPFAVTLAALVPFMFIVLRALEPMLPTLYDVRGIDLIFGPSRALGIASGMTASLFTLNLLAAVMLVAAAQLFRNVFQSTSHRQSLLLSYALFIGTLGQLQFAIVPPSYFGLVSAGDFIRVGFYISIVLAFDADTLATLRELRLSRAKVEELRLAELAEAEELQQAEMAEAVLEERSRLARDLHDGLAQELWLAKLRLGRLLKAVGNDQVGVDHEAGALSGAIDSAIAQARLAVIAMNIRPGDSHDLETALARYVYDVTERLDLPVTFRVERPAPPLDVRVSEEILRAVHEALHNVRKHADATSATVVLDGEEGVVKVSIRDDGRGLGPGHERRGYGLANMRARMEALGGHVWIESPGFGTIVRLEVPAPAVGAEAAAT
jgi:signal transduction histidine kinase